MQTLLRSPRLIPIMATVAVALTAGACGPRMIKGTKIRDTDDNRAIITLMEKYQKAMEERDVETILSIVSPTYHEGMGTFGGEDDYGYDSLRARLADRFSKLKTLRYVVKVNNIEVDGARAKVFYTYDLRMQFTVGDHDEWTSEVDDSRILLEKTPRGWMVVAGL